MNLKDNHNNLVAIEENYIIVGRKIGVSIIGYIEVPVKDNEPYSSVLSKIERLLSMDISIFKDLSQIGKNNE